MRRERGPEALSVERLGIDASMPTFPVDVRVNRSGSMVVPSYIAAGEQRFYYVDNVAGATGRMHVVGCLIGHR